MDRELFDFLFLTFDSCNLFFYQLMRAFNDVVAISEIKEMIAEYIKMGKVEVLVSDIFAAYFHIRIILHFSFDSCRCLESKSTMSAMIASSLIPTSSAGS